MIHPSPPAPFQPAFLLALSHGILAGVHLPGHGEPVPTEILARLHPEERAHASTLRGFRQAEFVGGRLAFGALLGEMGVRRTPVLSDPHGAPTLPGGLCGSITHKRDLAIAILARGGPGLGVDLEETDRDRPGVAERVLRPEELDAVQALPPERQWTSTAVRFALKEAVYKAIHPFFRRYVGFHEVAVWPSPDGIDRIEPRFDGDAPALHFDARHTWVDSRVLAMVRARPA